MSGTDYSFDAPDGCTWGISWDRDSEAWFVDVYVDEDDHARPPCTCKHPLDGVYDKLETVEVAIGSPIPRHVRDQLIAEAAAHPGRESGRRAWGRVYALEITRATPEGELWDSFAPTWADDPESPYWDPDNFPLVD